MIKVNPVKLNNSSRYISFRDNNNITPKTGSLALQAPDSEVKFAKNLAMTVSADAVQSNPIKALGYKIYKMFKVIFQPKISDADFINVEDRNLFELI